jgi:8-oxo-dGTP pyrophosphatase MutT (NUDIX family)
VSEEIRKAASVIAVRDDPDGPQVLVVERSTESRFLPGYVVFPGGAVDADDAALATSWFGTPTEAARAAAVRELAEEAGLVLTGRGLEPVRGDDPVGPASVTPPESGQLHELAHWIAPDDVPVRFDARYFAVSAPGSLEPVADGTEAARAWWATPERLLAEWEAGDRKLYWPTLLTVMELARCESAAELMALAIQTREPDDDEVDRLPRSVFWQD